MKKAQKDWKFYIGISCLVMSCILPLLGLIVPFLHLSLAVSSIIIGILTIGGPEILILLAVAFLGKETLTFIKQKVFAFFKRKKTIKPVSKFRYYFGLSILLASGIPLYLDAYFPHWLPDDKKIHYFVLVFSDLVFVSSFFILGDNFWEKFKNLFIYNDDQLTKKL